jgi:protein-tyrosine phosphatase
MSVEAPFRVLFVCTGNLCRSPAAEILARDAFARHNFPATVASAGLGAVVGRPVHPDTRAALAAWDLHGEAAESFRARQLTPDIVTAADLVLGLTTEHRAGIVRLAPRALRRAFTLREFARLTAAVDPATLPTEPLARAHAMVDAARAKRGSRPVEPGADDISDPIGRSAATHAEVSRAVAAAVHDIVGALAGTQAVGGRGPADTP